MIWGLFQLIPVSLYSQLPDYHLQFFDHAAGIRPGNINAVIKDKKGFLWVLYPRTVQQFDGRRTFSYKLNGDMTSLFCDEAGRVWAGSLRKIFLFDEQTGDFKEVPIVSTDSALYTGPVFNMAGKSWLITSSGFFEYDQLKSAFKAVDIQIPVPPRYNIRTFGNEGSSIFFGHNGMVYRYNIQTTKLDSLPDKNMRRIFPVNEDSILIHTWNISSYWYNFKENRISEARPPDKLREKNAGKSFVIRACVRAGKGKLIISSGEGIYEYDYHNSQYRVLSFYRDGNPASARDFANDMHADQDGYIWLATVDGVARFSLDNKSFGLIRIRQMKNELPAGIDNIRSITEDNEGNLWLATGHGFVCWERSTGTWKLNLPSEGNKKKLAFPSVRGIAYDGRNIILGPTDLGIWIYNKGKDQYKRPVYASSEVRKKSEGDFIDAITTLNNGDHLIMGRDALYLLKARDYLLSFVDVPAAKQNTNFSFQGKDGMIWLTTQQGLHLLDEQLNYVRHVKLPSQNPFVSAGFMMPDSRLLFALETGLYTISFNGKEPVIKKFTDQFDDIFVTSLFVDQRGILWATSDNGIYRYDTASSKLNLFDYSDNVQGYGFNSNSWHESHDGILFMGGINGLNYFDPVMFSTKDDSLKVFIQQVKNGHNDLVLYSPDQKIILPFAERSLEVEFAAPYYNNPDKVKYRYQLEGFDIEWKQIGNNNSVHFTSLPAGEYTLKVEASVNNVDWIAANNNLSFRIKNPFWLQPWFIFSSLALLAVMIWQVIRSRNKKIRDQKEELEAEQAINYFSSSMYRHQSVDEILWDVARNCIGKLLFEDCVIYLVDENKKTLIQKAAHGSKSIGGNEITQPIEIPLGNGITGTVAVTGRAEIIADTSKDSRYIIDGVRRNAEITVPIIADGKILGVIDCEHSKKGFFTQKHLSILTTIASLCAGKIIKAKAEEEKNQAEEILMATKQKMADVEMQALRAQMNPHFIFNCLNSINRYIVKSDQATASLYLTRFARLIRLILDNSNSKYVTLYNELEALKLYIEMEAIRFEKQFTYQIEVDTDIKTDSVSVPPMIIQPYVENAIWHGLLHKEEAGHLFVHISKISNSLLQCVIEDNGVGRTRALELKSKSAATKKSLGMKLTEDRLALLNKQARIDASVEIADLVTTTGEAAGTKVILKIPVDE